MLQPFSFSSLSLSPAAAITTVFFFFFYFSFLTNANQSRRTYRFFSWQAHSMCVLICVNVTVCVSADEWVPFKQIKKSHTLNSMGILFYWIWLIDEREKLDFFLYICRIFKNLFFRLVNIRWHFYLFKQNHFEKHDFFSWRICQRPKTKSHTSNVHIYSFKAIL